MPRFQLSLFRARLLGLARKYPERIYWFQVTGRAFLDMELAGGAATTPVFELKRLELQNCRRLSAPATEWIAASCASLHSLNVHGCASTSPEGIELLAASPPALENLDIAGCARMNNMSLSFIAEHGASLRHLDISDIPGASAMVVGKLLRICKILQSFDISGLTSVNRSSFHGLSVKSDIDTELKTDSCMDLRQTKNRRHNRHHPEHDGENACVRELQRSAASPGHAPASTEVGLQHLRVARMLRLPNLDDASVTSLAEACPSLQGLFLSDSPMVTGACLEPLSALCPLIQTLALDRCGAASDEAALIAALQQLHDLRDLRAAREGFGTDTRGTVTTTGRNRNVQSPGSSIAPRLPRMDTRAPFGAGSVGRLGVDVEAVPTGVSNITGREVAPRGDSLTGDIFVSIARYCVKLTRLGLEGHGKMTVAVGAQALPPGALPCLREMRLEGCSGIDDRGLEVLLAACPCMRTLSVLGSGVSQQALAQASTTRSFVEVLRSPPPPPPPSPYRPTRRGNIAKAAHMSSGDAAPRVGDLISGTLIPSGNASAQAVNLMSGVVAPPCPPDVLSRDGDGEPESVGSCLRPKSRATLESSAGETRVCELGD